MNNISFWIFIYSFYGLGAYFIGYTIGGIIQLLRLKHTREK